MRPLDVRHNPLAGLRPHEGRPGARRRYRAASLVEANAQDYVEYLRKVFKGDPETMAVLERWGPRGATRRRTRPLSRLADPTFDFAESFARFRAGYKPEHFVNADGLVRGSRIGELIARCVVECGTSSGYTALRDAVDEPVLKQIAGLIAADEFAHYRLFYDLMQIQPEAKPPHMAQALDRRSPA